MKKVLHLASWYPNKTGTQDGDFIQRHLQAISTRQPVEVIHVVKDIRNTPGKGIIEKNRNGLLNETIVYYYPLRVGVPFIDKVISFISYRAIFKKEIRRYILQHGLPDLIHVHVAFRAGLLALWAKRKYDIPFIVSEHWTGYQNEDPDNYSRKNFFFRYYVKKILEGATWVTAVSENLLQRLRTIARIKRCSVIYNVVNTDLFFHKPGNSPKFRFIHVSSMHPQKNIEGLLLVLSKLKEVRIDWECIMIGPSREEYLNMTSALHLTGYVEWKDEMENVGVAVEMQQSTILLMCSKYENLPCIICEALCCGVPVISSNVGGIREIVDDESGELFEPGNPDQFLKIILKTMNNGQRYNTRLIASNAFNKFNYSVVAEKFIETYEHA